MSRKSSNAHLSKKNKRHAARNADSDHEVCSPKDKKATSTKNTKRYVQENPSDFDDEMDAFHKDRDLVLLSGREEEQGDSDKEDAVLDLPSSEDGQDSDACEESESWGRAKKNYYEADLDAKDEEAAAAAKLHRKRLSALREADFGVAADDGKRKRAGAAAAVYFSSSEDEDQAAQPPAMDDEAFKEIQDDLRAKQAFLEQHLAPLVASPPEHIPAALDRGMAFLRLKHKLLRSYCTMAAFFVAAKLEGKSEDLQRAAIDKMVEHRLLLERIRPMEVKLQPQVDRLLQAASAEEQQESAVKAGALELVSEDDEDTMLAKPRPDLMRRAAASDGEDGGAEGRKYRAPKTVPMVYPGDAKRKPRSRLLQVSDGDSENGDAPERIRDFALGSSDDEADAAAVQNARARRVYEEENMMRFTETRKERRLAEKRAKPVDELDELTKFFDKTERMRRESAAAGSDSEGEAPAGKRSKQKSKHSGSEESMSEIEDDMPLPKKASRSAGRGATSYRPINDIGPNGIRPITYAISKNKGLTPHRPSDYRNPRVRNRTRFEKATKRLGSFKKVGSGDRRGKYSGESSGIRTNISRSVRY